MEIVHDYLYVGYRQCVVVSLGIDNFSLRFYHIW